jgi:HK97 family phage portal protein
VVTSLCLNGNSFIYVGRNGSGQIESLYALDPRSVYIQDIGNGNAIYHVGDAKLTSKEIVHIPAFTVPGMVRGLSPIDAAREAVGLGLTAEEFGARFFSQGTAMAGVIEHPGNPKPGEAKMLRQMFRKTHAGVKNSHAVGVLTGGAQFKPITMSPESAQFLETRKFQRHEIALLYRVPAYMVDPTTTSTWGAGIEEQNKWFVTQTLGPWITRIEQAVSTFLLPRRRSFKFNIDARMRPNTSDRFTAYEKAINAGIMSPDEARALEDMPPIPDGRGETFWRPNYTATIEALQDKMFAEQNQTTGENGNGK